MFVGCQLDHQDLWSGPRVSLCSAAGDKEKHEYEEVSLLDLPNLSEYCARLAALNTLLLTINNKKDSMIKYYLSRVKYTSDLIVCDVNSQSLITKGEEE